MVEVPVPMTAIGLRKSRSDLPGALREQPAGKDVIAGAQEKVHTAAVSF